MTSTSTTVSGRANEAPPVATSTTATPAAGTTGTPAAPIAPADWQKQLDELNEKIAEGQRATEFWAKKAKGGEPVAPATAEEPEEDILEVLTTKGAKGFDALLTKRGFVREKDVDAKVNAKAAAISKEQELIKEYPDLSKPESEFFKQVALRYGQLYKGGISADLAMEMAAESAALKFMREGKMKTPSQIQEESKAQRETDRRARIAAQAGEGGGRTPAASDEEDDELTDIQKNIARSMGITEDAYKARAKKGVAMKGIK